MATFDITAPDGRRFRITGDSPEGAHAALMKHLGTVAPSAQGEGAETAGFGDPLLEALRNGITVPDGRSSSPQPAPTSKPAPTAAPVPTSGPGHLTRRAPPLPPPDPGRDAAPLIDQARPPAPPLPPRNLDRLEFGMMGGASPEMEAWARREITRQEAERGNGQNGQNADPLLQAMEAPASGFVPTEPEYTPTGEAILSELGNVPERVQRGFVGNKLAAAEKGIRSDLQTIGRAKTEAADPRAALAAVRQQKAELGLRFSNSTDINERNAIEAQIRALGQEERRLAHIVAVPGMADRAEKDDVVVPPEKPMFGGVADAFRMGEATAVVQGQDFGRDISAALEEGVVGRTLYKMRKAVGIETDTPEQRAEAIRNAPRGAVYESSKDQLDELAEKGFNVTSWSDVDGLRSGVRFVAENLSTSLPQMATALASGALAPVSQTILLGAEANEELKERTDLPEAQRVAIASGAGIAMWALETIGLGKIFGGMLPGEFAKRAANGTLAKWLTSAGLPGFAARILEAGVFEGSTETIQDGIIMAVTALGGGRYTADEVKDRLSQAFIAGGAVGSSLRGAVEPFSGRGGEDEGKPATKPPAKPKGASPYRPVTPIQPKPEEAPADPLVAAMGGEAAPARPAAPAPPAAPQADAAPSPVENPAEMPVEREAEAEPEADPQYEILDEVETVDGETRPTGRKVRVDLTTGEASVVDADEAAGGAPPAGAPARTRAEPEAQPQEEASSVGTGARPAAGSARAAPQRRFLTHEETLSIETDPQTFQYKGGADTEGVTTALQGVTRFDPNRAGQVVLFETRDGRLIVADGHQRTGLARRMAQAGQADVGGMAAVIYREADGYTPEEVMRLAAIKNIGEGSGSAVDAARVLRSSAETVEDLGLPPQSALVRTAEGLRRLSDEAFGMVVNGRASERDGAIVGRVVANRDAQIGILGLLARLKPANAFQAESIARQAAAEVTTETQSSLFGDEEVAANLYLERAKILDNAVKRLADEKRLFGTLTERIEAITAAGNVLAKDENARRVDLAARMRDYLASQANLKGPISDALSQAARDLKAGTPVATATGRFLESLQRAMEVGGGRGEAAPGGRSVDQGEGRREEPQRQEVSPPEDDLLAAMGVKPDPATRPEPKPEPAPQDGDDLLAAMGAKPQKNPEPAARAEAEAKVKAAQSKKGTTTPQGDAGPLFDTQGDIEKVAAKPTGHDLIMRGRAILAPFERDRDDVFDRNAGDDLTGSAHGRALADELAGVASLKEKTDIAVRWVTEQGKRTGVEHGVILDADGVPLAIMSGHKSGVSFHSAVWRAGAAGKIAVSVHNHPSSGGPSAADLAILALWPKHRLVIAGHNGDVHEITATEAFDKAGTMDDAQPAEAMAPVREELQAIFDAIRIEVNARAREVARERNQSDDGLAAYTNAVRRAFALAMERAGMIRYTQTAEGLRIMQAEGFDFEAIYGQISGTLADRLGRAGFDVVEKGRAGRDQAAGSGTEAAPPGTDSPDREPAEDGERGDRGGRVSTEADKVASDDFDAALDAVFGATPADPTVAASGDRDYAAWASGVPSPGRENGWTIFDDTEIGGSFVLKTRDLDVRPFKSEADARAWAKKNAPASVRKAEAAPPEPAFDAEAFDSDRKKRIAASKADGNTHLDQVEPSVEMMRGKAIYYVHDPKVRGVIRTVSNAKEVVVHWSDDYSAEKEMAVEKTYGKKRVMESWLAPSDLKDYVLGTPDLIPMTAPPKKAATAVSPWRVERYEKATDPSQEWRVARNNGDNQRDVWGYYATKEEAESARAYAAKRAPASEKPPQRQASDIAKDLGDLFNESEDLFGETPQPQRSMTQRERAEIEARARQSKMRTSVAQKDAGPLFGDQDDLFGFNEPVPQTLADQIDALDSIIPGWTEGAGGMLTNPHARGGIIDKAIASGEWFVVFGNGWESVDGYKTRGEAVAEFVRSSKAGTDPTKYRKAVPLFREALAGVDMAEMPRKDVFVAMIRPLAAAGLKREAVAKMRPYFDRFLRDLDDGIITLDQEASNAPGTGGDLERDRGDAGSQDRLGKADVPAATRGDGSRAGTRGATPDGRGEFEPSGERVSPDDAAPVGAGRDQGIQGDGRPGQQPADDRDGAAGRDSGEPRIPDDDSPAAVTRGTARNAPAVSDRVAAQKAADEIAGRGIRLADEKNVRDTLPLLLPEQQDDVVKIERRFLKPDGHGMLITNGTGTGKTYSGGGVIKRFAQQGKTDILVLAPSQGILDHWIDALHDLGLSATKLESTTDAGRGIVLTTYANAGVNTALARRKWDLVVSDEAHNLSQNAAGDPTDALNTLRAITHRPADLSRKSDMLHADEWAKMKAMKDGEAKTAEAHRLFKRRSAEVAAMAKEPRPKVLFLSATPFAYDKNIDYGEGYLFDYPADGYAGHSRQSGQNLFMVANFGYRIRYHKLTKPDANVDSGVFEREFHEKLRREGMLSGRHLDIEPDYERRFVQREDAQGAQIDGILDFIRQEAYGKGPDKDAYYALLRSINKNFNYLRRMQLLEAIKAKAAQPDIDKHLEMGRKVVIFHDYNVGGGFNPFRPGAGPDGPADQAAYEGYAALIAAKPEAENLNFTGYLPPVEELKRAYGKRAVVYNGTIPTKDRAMAKREFNKDGSGVDIMIVQSAAGEAGISLHDVTGSHQRVLINLGMPTRPTTALQEEGRIRREGSVSDALFHYYTIGTTWERQAFARKIAERSGTVENLALGNEARTIRDSFIEAYENASPWEPGDTDGKGGKARDRAIAKASPYEIAKTHYFGRMKTAGRRDQREGIDFYPTPEPLAFKMVEWAGIRQYERVLEPSAGDGSIARYFPEHSDRTIVEPSADLLSRAELRAVGARAVGSTFEAYHIVNKHHVVVMNPPFGIGGKTAMEHLAKAARHLRPGGRIVALIPTGPAADKRFDAWWDSDDSMGLVRSAEVALPAVTFEKAGTSIAAKVVILDKIPSPSDRDAQREMAGGTKRINMTGASTIGEFFDRLEGISVPDRPAQQRDAADEIMDEEEAANPPMAAPERPAAPLHGTDQEFTLGETTHGKTGEKLWVATATKRVDDAAWKATVAVAKRHGGWFSSFRGRGAIPGYQFKSEADRQAFLDDMKKPTVGFEQPAWHGSPHIFDRFSTDKIGTGEGAQVYGWGLYFAGRKEVAEHYKRTLSRADLALDGADVPAWMLAPFSAETAKMMDEMLSKAPPERPAEISDAEWRGMKVLVPYSIRSMLRNLRDKVSYDGDDPSARLQVYRDTALAQYKSAEARDVDRSEYASKIAAADWLASRVSRTKAPRLYKVDIPEDSDLLAWDKPLGEQPKKVRDAFSASFPEFSVDAAAKSEWVERPETEVERRSWMDQYGWQIVDHGRFFAVISPANKSTGGNSVAEKKTLLQAQQTANAARAHFASSLTAKDAYYVLSSRLGGDAAASAVLRDAGIPGHRYLDQGSRQHPFRVDYGKDGNYSDHNSYAEAKAELDEIKGQFPNARIIDNGTYNYVIYDADVIEITGFEETDPGFARDPYEPLPREAIAAMMPRLRAELDRLDLKRVRLFQDNTAADWQGMFLRYPGGGMEIIIGASLDPMKTIHHEVIHILRRLNLFTPQEWRALEIMAARKWVEEFDIVARYPHLMPSEQIEEAIAEAFAEAASTRKAPGKSLIVQAFNKIVRIFRAIRNVFNGAGLNTPEEVFGKVIAGELTRRNAGNTGALTAFQEEERLQAGRTLLDARMVEKIKVAIEAGGRPDPAFPLRAMPPVLNALGVRNTPLIVRKSVFTKADQKHGLDTDEVVDAINALRDPVMVFDSDTLKDGLVALVETSRGGTMVVAIHPSDEVGRMEVSSIASVYEKTDARIIPNWMTKGLMRYMNKRAAEAWFRSRGLQLPREGTAHRRKIKILQYRDVFKGGPGLEAPSAKFQAARVPNRQARAHMATAMGSTAAFIPDRRVWEELTRAGAPIWQRLRQGAGAAHDAIDRARIVLQDRFLPVLRAQEAVERRLGMPLPADHNAYIAETTFSGKVGRHLFEIDEDYTKPIIDLIARTRGALTADAVGEWLYARHAIERNDYIASINPKMPDGGSGMMTADAQAILAAAAAGPHAKTLAEIGDLVDKLRERTLRLREDAGLITHAEANLWRTQYAHYVPLKGFSETDHSEAVLDLTGVGRRFAVRGPESRRALGRRSEAFNPLQAAITQAQEVAIRAEKNRVGQALYELAKDFPSPALWSVKKIAMKRYFNRTTGLVETRAENPAQTMMDPNETAVKVGGKEYRITFHDPRLARAAGTVGADQMGWFLSAMSMAARYFSSINTMLDPSFVIRNAFRDMQAAQINIRNFGEADRNAIAKAMIRDWPKAFVGAFRGMGNKADSDWTRYYREFEKAGAKVSFWRLDQPEAGKADLDKRIRLAGGSRLGPASRFVRLSTRDNPVLGFVERTNLAVDNAVRLAAFVAARKRGWSAQDAAALAKNLTVNFNRRGEWGATINALYPFANAGIQGTQIMFRAMTSRRMAKYVVGLIALGLILDAVNAGLSAEDDDGELAYDKIPDWKNRTNLAVMLGPEADDAANIWMPYGYSLMPYLGQQIGKVRRGVKEPGQAMADFAAAMFGAFSPLSGETLNAVLTPTMLDPINEMAMNEDWLGRPIRPENAYADYGPDAYKYFAGASDASKALADTMNRATGGSIAESGLIDVSPEYIDHMLGFATGGMGRFVGRTVDVISKSVTGNFEEIESRNIPLVRDVLYETGDWLDRDRYYRFRDEVRAARAAVKAYNAAGRPVPRNVAVLDALYDDMLAAERELKNLRKQGGEGQTRVFLAFNRQFLKAAGKQGE